MSVSEVSVHLASWCYIGGHRLRVAICYDCELKKLISRIRAKRFQLNFLAKKIIIYLLFGRWTRSHSKESELN